LPFAFVFILIFNLTLYLNIKLNQLLPLIALWSYAHRVGTTFALDWSKAREAKEENKNKNKSKGIKGKS
jgi:hypothetical protein